MLLCGRIRPSWNLSILSCDAIMRSTPAPRRLHAGGWQAFTVTRPGAQAEVVSDAPTMATLRRRAPPARGSAKTGLSIELMPSRRHIPRNR